MYCIINIFTYLYNLKQYRNKEYILVLITVNIFISKMLFANGKLKPVLDSQYTNGLIALFSTKKKKKNNIL